MSLGTDGEERLPTGSLFDAKENGGADFQCRAVDHRYPARTQAGRPFTLRVVPTAISDYRCYHQFSEKLSPVADHGPSMVMRPTP